MNDRDRHELCAALAALRSGDRWRIEEGERMLMRLAGWGGPACACPDYPAVKGRDCTAHTYVAQSVIESLTQGTVSLRGAVRSVRARVNSNGGGDGR